MTGRQYFVRGAWNVFSNYTGSVLGGSPVISGILPMEIAVISVFRCFKNGVF